jgi:hypothetical protein
MTFGSNSVIFKQKTNTVVAGIPVSPLIELLIDSVIVDSTCGSKNNFTVLLVSRKGYDISKIVRINPHEAKENIHLRPTSISRTLFRFFSFSGTSVGLSKSRDTGAAQKKELACPIQRATMLACTIGAAAPIGAVLYHHAYIGPILVIPPR